MKTLVAVFCVLVAMQAAEASESFQEISLENGVTLTVKKIRNNRSLPQAFYDQTVASVPTLYSAHAFVAKRRNGRLGNVLYSIACYKEDVKLDLVTASGTAVSDGKAWFFESRVPESSFGDDLLILMEAVANLPVSQALGTEAPPPRDAE